MGSSALKVHLDTPYSRTSYHTHVFGPGDKVAGKVVFSPESDESIESIYVEFRGKCETKISHGNDSQIYERQMFRLTETLFQGPYKMKAATYEYPFSFTFPEKFLYRGLEFRDDGRFELPGPDGMLWLPPSCVDYGDRGGSCEVHYHVTATIPRTFMDWEDKILLSFCPWRTELHVPEMRKEASQREARLRRYRLSEEGVPRLLTKKEVFKEGFKKSAETKFVDFSMSATAPTRIVAGKSYPVEITLTSNGAEQLGTVPEFRIKSCAMFVKSQTYIRVPGAFTDHLDVFDGHIPLTSSSRVDVVLPLGEKQTFNGMFRTRGPFPPPTFSSWAFKRTYGLELKAIVECLGEEEKFKIHWMNVEVLPGKTKTGDGEAIREIEEGMAEMAVAAEGLSSYTRTGEESLPRYEKHVDKNALDL